MLVSSPFCVCSQMSMGVPVGSGSRGVSALGVGRVWFLFIEVGLLLVFVRRCRRWSVPGGANLPLRGTPPLLSATPTARPPSARSRCTPRPREGGSIARDVVVRPSCDGSSSRPARYMLAVC
jgi:hypothetical protein